MKVIARSANPNLRLLNFERKYHEKFWLAGPEYYDMCDFRCVYCITESQGKGRAMYSSADEVEAVLREELNHLPGPVEHTLFVLNPASDPYIPIEEELLLTRRIIEVLHEKNLKFTFCTKGTLVKRDAELLAACGEQAKAIISLSSTDEEQIKRLDGSAPSAQERIETIHYLHEKGVNVCLSIAPWLPGISDTENLVNSIPEEVFVYVQPLDMGEAFEETFDNRRKQFSAYSVFHKRYTLSEANQLYVADCNRYGNMKPNMEWRYPITKDYEDAQHKFIDILKPGKHDPKEF